MKRRDFLKGIVKATAATAVASTIVEKVDVEGNVVGNYIECTRCGRDIQIDDIDADAVKCPRCGVFNLLGMIVQREVAKRRGSMG